jgi:threonine synthase
VLVSTAHPGKFREIVEPLVGKPVPMPPSLAQLFARAVHCVDIEATLPALRAALQGEKAT